MTTLLIPYGLDSGDRIVHVDDVPRGKACGARCAGCDSELVANKGPIRRHYFSHYQANSHGCEGWLHKTAKRILHQRITRSIARRSPFPIKWSCSDKEPAFVHEVDLLGKGILNNASLEQHLPTWNIRPDITLMAGDTPKGLIEVVDTHRPQPPVLESGLPVLEVHVSEGANLDVLAKGTIPVAVMHNYPCPEPKRSKYCRRCLLNRKMQVTLKGGLCYMCDRPRPRRRSVRCMKCGETLVEGRMAYRHRASQGWQLRNLHDFAFRLDWRCRTCHENVTALAGLMQEPPGRV